MADASLLAQFFANWTPTTWSVVVAIFLGVIALVKVWPLIKAKVNEARKIELDADADLRGDLLGRIKVLEESRDGEPARINAAILAERLRCDGELAQRDAKMGQMELVFDRRINELVNIIRQNSQSTAQLLGDPAALALSKAKRKEPE